MSGPETKHTVFWMLKALAYEAFADADPRTKLVRVLCQRMNWHTFKTEPIDHAELLRLTGFSRSTLKRTIRAVLKAKVFEVASGRGRGNKSVFTLCQQAAKKGSAGDPFSYRKGSKPETQKGPPGDPTQSHIQESDSGRRADRSIQGQAEPSVSWLSPDDNEALWNRVAKRWAAEKGYELIARGSHHGTGIGAFIPTDWLN